MQLSAPGFGSPHTDLPAVAAPSRVRNASGSHAQPEKIKENEGNAAL